MKTRGGCGCGAVTFTAQGKPRWQGYCHCRSCQRAHAAPLLACAIFSVDDFSFSGGVELVTVTGGEGATKRFVCTRCGTKVFNQPHPSVRTVMISLCEERDWFQPEAHLWWSERLVDVADDLPKFLDFPAPFGGSGRLAD